MAKTWPDGSYKFPYMEFEKYNAVNYADDVMGEDITRADEAADIAEKATGVSRDFIAGTLKESYEIHRRSLSGLREEVEKTRENSEKTVKKVEEIEREERRSRKYKRLEGKEEYIEYFYSLGAKVNILADAFGVSSTQMSNYIRDIGIKERVKRKRERNE